MRCAYPATPPPNRARPVIAAASGHTGVVPVISAVHGDITTQQVDAVVNAANRAMRGGGGVDGAIHRAGGPAILRDCIKRFPGGLTTGDAGWTTAGDLPARWVIHTVGPNYRAGERDRSLLHSCYRRSLEVADELGARTVAFPLVSAGIYGWPRSDAIPVAIDAIARAETRVEDVSLVIPDEAVFREVRAAVQLRCPAPVVPDTVGALLVPEPMPFGLRGDVYLWLALRARFAQTPLPSSAAELRTMLADAIEQIVGRPLASEDPAYVPEFDPGHGLSAGTVDLPSWARTAVPAVVDRYVRRRRAFERD